MNHVHNAIALNLSDIRQSIVEAAQHSGRNSNDIRLIAVSKKQTHAAIAAALDAGHKDFGENTVQEAVSKISYFSATSATWHFIGHLQSNKAKFIPGNFGWLHSLDNVGVALTLARLAQEKSTVLNTLLGVNIARDPKKHGLAPETVPGFIEQLLKENLPALSLRGLMTIGPHPAAEKEIRRCFAELRALRDECARRFALPHFTELSMGMSGDFVEAIKEGATMVRIGTAIFGARARTSIAP